MYIVVPIDRSPRLLAKARRRGRWAIVALDGGRGGGPLILGVGDSPRAALHDARSYSVDPVLLSRDQDRGVVYGRLSRRAYRGILRGDVPPDAVRRLGVEYVRHPRRGMLTVPRFGRS